MAIIEPGSHLLHRGGSCLIRVGEESDAPAMVAHQGHMVATDPNTVREPGDPDRSLAEWQEYIRKAREEPCHLLLFAFDPRPPEGGPEGGLIGGLHFSNGNRRKVAHHGHFGLSVHADWRGMGVGSAMISVLLNWAAANPTLEKVCLGTLATNEGAKRLYERLGFVEESRVPRFFKLEPGRYVDDIQMSIYVKPGIAPEGFRTFPSVK